jgi:predicted nuclease with TOPRIM domain
MIKKHHARCEALREENTRLQHEKNALEEGKQTLQARCTALDTELAEVKAILDHINNVRVKLPRCLLRQPSHQFLIHLTPLSAHTSY